MSVNIYRGDELKQIAGASRKYPIMVGATDTVDGVEGTVPTPLKGDEGNFLRGDGTWQEVVDKKDLIYYTNQYAVEDVDGKINADLIIGLSDIAKSGELIINDDSTDAKYKIGVKNGKLYYDEV